MITTLDLKKIYQWAKDTRFPTKSVPTADGYSNKNVNYCWLKAEGKSKDGSKPVKYLNKKIVKNPDVVEILNNQDIIFVTFSSFDSWTILNPHRDPDIYRERYKRIQLPINIPHPNHCFMIWDNKKVTWKEGVAQTYPVMDVTHEGYNLSTKSMEFVMIDVKLDAEVENETNS
tara:strand:+ start:5876 stop:6394 length:519 start_codon:yes stop_codon:yes gene_type:complete